MASFLSVYFSGLSSLSSNLSMSQSCPIRVLFGAAAPLNDGCNSSMIIMSMRPEELVVGGGNFIRKKKGSFPSFTSSSSCSAAPNSNYVVPLDKSSSLIRPLAEILRDLNKRVPDKVINPQNNSISWYTTTLIRRHHVYHANRMLSFYAPGWCGEIRKVMFSENDTVTVVYRVTIKGSDGEAHRESTGTISLEDGSIDDPVAAAEEIAFCRACARFGLGLYLYHEDEII